MRTMWPDRTISGRVMAQRLTEMGGCPVNNDARLYQLAKHLDLPRRTSLWEKQDLETEVPRPASLSTEDLAEGDRNIRAGWTPAQLVDWFGITLPEAAAWHAGLRKVDELVLPANESAIGEDEADATQGSRPEAAEAPSPGSTASNEAATESAEMPTELAEVSTISPEPALPPPDVSAATEATPALSFPEDPQGREVWEAFDSGMSVRDVGADFGIPLSTLTNTHAQWQLTRRKELS